MATTTLGKTIKVVFLVATTLAMVVALTFMTVTYDKQEGTMEFTKEQPLVLPSKRVSRFLAQSGNYGSSRSSNANPKAADHCNKDNEICKQQPAYGANATCCNNKCIDLSEDDKNCGACKNKCEYTEHCCRGECVNLSYDKRFCGSCYNKCLPGQFCVYGMCDYA